MFSETTTSPHYSKGRGIAMYRISFFQRALNLCWDTRGPMKIEKFHNYKEKIWAMTAPEGKASKMDFLWKKHEYLFVWKLELISIRKAS